MMLREAKRESNEVSVIALVLNFCFDNQGILLVSINRLYVVGKTTVITD